MQVKCHLICHDYNHNGPGGCGNIYCWKYHPDEPREYQPVRSMGCQCVSAEGMRKTDEAWGRSQVNMRSDSAIKIELKVKGEVKNEKELDSVVQFIQDAGFDVFIEKKETSDGGRSSE